MSENLKTLVRELLDTLETVEETDEVAAGAPGSTLSAQVLVYQPELTHSVWIDYYVRYKSRETLEKRLRREVRAGRYVGYRLHTIAAEYIGATWPNNQVSNSGQGTTK